MSRTQYPLIIKITTAAAFLVMIAINALANILPINGITTGAVSDSYPNLFAPAGLTFTIWGLIYVLLLIFVLDQTGLFRRLNEQQQQLLRRISPYFIISSLANTLWIICWHYGFISLSLLPMLAILLSLLTIMTRFDPSPMTIKDELLIRLPFSVYTGWITVAMIANITTALVSQNWTGWGISEEIWTIVALAAGLLIGTITILKRQDIAYGLVLVWAYIGIAIKRYDAAPRHSLIILAVFIAIAIFLLADFYIAACRFLQNRKLT